MIEPPELFGDYLLLERINQSRTGDIYKAKHRSMGRVVAIKVLSPEAGRSRMTWASTTAIFGRTI